MNQFTHTDENKKLVSLEASFPILKYFKYGHLPESLQATSKPFSDLAHEMARNSTADGKPETEAGLRKLLEAKDCAVRAMIK